MPTDEFVLPANMMNARLIAFVKTMPEPLQLETFRPEGGKYAGQEMHYWYWVLAGRMFVSSWSVSEKDCRRTRAAREAQAYSRLLAFVHGSLPARDSTAWEDGSAIVPDGTDLPKPPAKQPTFGEPG